MSCPRNAWGQPSCCITAHPDHPEAKFCATCGKKFREEISFFHLLIAIALTVFLFSLVESKPEPVSEPSLTQTSQP